MSGHTHGWMVVAALATASCAPANSGRVAAAATASQATTTDIAASGDGTAHGDHNPHHGGTVYMHGDMHYEVVLDPAGQHRVYFSDAVREDLPASVARNVSLTVERPGQPKEQLAGRIDLYGESWVLDGSAVATPDTNVRVTFEASGGTYWIDVPFIPPAP